MQRSFLSLVLVALISVSFVGVLVVPAEVVAQVRSNNQPKKSNKGFFGWLFGGGNKRIEQVRPSRQKSRRSSPSRGQSRNSGVAAVKAPKITEKEKSKDAKILLVVGDDLAKGLADGLRAVYAETPSIKVKKNSFILKLV